MNFLRGSSQSGFLVERRFHPGGDSLLVQRLLVLLTQERIFVIIGNGGAAILEVDRAVVDILFPRPAPATPRSVGSEPSGQAQRLLAGAEMRVEPVAAHRRGADHADRLVVLTLHALVFPCSLRPTAYSRRHRDRYR